MTTKRLLITHALLLLGLIASSCKDGQKEIQGTYVGKTSSLVETITILPDGVFTQTIGIGGEVYTNSGQWSLKDNAITFRGNFLLRHDIFSGKIVFPPKDYLGFHAL